MADEQLSLINVHRGLSVFSTNDLQESGLYLVTITKEGKLLAEPGVPQNLTNFETIISNRGTEKVQIR